MTETVIHTRGLRRRYGDTTAVDGIDLTIARGEVFGLLGPNGAGKTTTVEILEGQRRRDGGEASVLGRDPGNSTRRWRSRIGIVWQNAVSPGQLTVSETVRHFAAYFPCARDAQQVIERVGLAGREKTRVNALSGGQRRRVDVALGVIGAPELLFLDEPTTGFDPAARRQFWELIRQLAADGTTIVLTSHYLDEMEALADRLAVVVQGRVAAEGTPSSLGGRAHASATVAWSDSDGPHQLLTDTPTATVGELATRFPGEIPELTVSRPSLEDTYLELIGRQRQDTPGATT